MSRTCGSRSASNAIAPFKGPARSLLLTTGAEAVENAVKIARVATGRSAVISFSGAFHGRTQLTLSLTGRMLPYKRGLTGGIHDVFRIPFPVEHRNMTVKESLSALDALFHTDIEPPQVAAIIIEPVQGRGRFSRGSARAAARAARAVQPVRHRAHRGRDPVGLRPHRPPCSRSSIPVWSRIS